MKRNMPITRAQEVVGVPFHPCEAIIRNGFTIAPYEEMEVRFFDKHCGLFHSILLGEPFTAFGFKDGIKCKTTLEDGCMPVITNKVEYEKYTLEQTVFATLLDTDKVTTGKEDMILMYKLSFKAKEDVVLPVRLQFSDCFQKQKEPAFYWKEFLLRDDIRANFSSEEELPEYPFKITAEKGVLYAEDKGILFQTCGDGNFYKVFGNGSFQDGTLCHNVWSFEISLKSGETTDYYYKVPYLPLDKNKLPMLKALDFKNELKKTKKMWREIFEKSSELVVPGTRLSDLWKAQTAYTFILMDRQNKGDSTLFGREMINSWAKDGYPDKILTYPHLSPTLYEFLWAQESSYFVLGALDLQGYHEEVEKCMEVFFELQGKGVAGVHDKSILPDTNYAASFMGTTPHAWLNSNGGVLQMIAMHYDLTKNAKWICDHKESILKSCRWITELRKTTKSETNIAYQGIMPRGQSTDATFASDHLQSYYTDVPTYLALRDITAVMKELGFAEYDEFSKEVKDYEFCLLRSIDLSVLDIDDFKEDIADYDYSSILFENPFPTSRITKYEPNGVPTFIKDLIYTKSSAKAEGLKGYITIFPQIRVPIKTQYLDMCFINLIGMLYKEIDFDKDTPLYPNAKHTGKQLWDIIENQSEIMGLRSVKEIHFGTSISYSFYDFHKMLACNERKNYENGLRWMSRFAHPDTFVMMEDTGTNYPPEEWWIPCPFALSMASYRTSLRNALLFEEGDSLVVGKLIPNEWIDNMITYEEPIMFNRSATNFGKVDIRYDYLYSTNTVKVTVKFHDTSRMPKEIEVRGNYSGGLPLKRVTVNDRPYEIYNMETESVRIKTDGNVSGYEIYFNY